MPRKRNPATKLARHASEIAVAAPQVVAIRVARMALAGATPSAQDRREFKRMHTEKADAFTQGWLAMWTETARIQQQAALTAMTTWWLPKSTSSLLPSAGKLSRDALAIMGKGLAPVRHRAVANAKRLGRR
jgi:hypothetical protein